MLVCVCVFACLHKTLILCELLNYYRPMILYLVLVTHQPSHHDFSVRETIKNKNKKQSAKKSSWQHVYSVRDTGHSSHTHCTNNNKRINQAESWKVRCNCIYLKHFTCKHQSSSRWAEWMPSVLAVNVDHVTNTIQSCSRCSTELKDIDIALFALTTSFCSVILTFIPQLSVFHYFFCSLYLKSFAFWNYSLTTACLSSEFSCHEVSRCRQWSVCVSLDLWPIGLWPTDTGLFCL